MSALHRNARRLDVPMPGLPLLGRLTRMAVSGWILAY
jgi:hypothetical protein